MAISGIQLSSVAIGGNEWEARRGFQRHSEALSGTRTGTDSNQWHSEALSGTRTGTDGMLKLAALKTLGSRVGDAQRGGGHERRIELLLPGRVRPDRVDQHVTPAAVGHLGDAPKPL